MSSAIDPVANAESCYYAILLTLQATPSPTPSPLAPVSPNQRVCIFYFQEHRPHYLCYDRLKDPFK